MRPIITLAVTVASFALSACASDAPQGASSLDSIDPMQIAAANPAVDPPAQAQCAAHLGAGSGFPAPTALRSAGVFHRCGSFGTGRASEVELSADGRRVALLTTAGQATVLDARSLHVLATFTHGSGPVALVGISPDGRRLVTVEAYSGHVAIWDIQKQELLRLAVHAPGREVSYWGPGDVAFSRDGRRFAVVSGRQVEVFDSETGTPLPISARSDIGGAMRAAFAVDDTRLVLGRFQVFGNGPYLGWGGVDLVDADTGDHPTHLEKQLYIELAAFSVSPDGERIALGAAVVDTWPVTIFDARTGAALGDLPTTGMPLGYDATGTRLATLERAAAPVLVRVRDVQSGAVVHSVEVEASGQPRVPSRDLSVLFVGGAAESALARVDLQDGRTHARACGSAYPPAGSELSISRDDRVLALSAATGYVAWDVDTGAARDAPSSDARKPSAVSADGKLSAHPPRNLGEASFELREAATGSLLRKIGPQAPTPARFDFAPDGSMVASTSDLMPSERRSLSYAYVWSVPDGELMQRVPGSGEVLFSNDGRRLFVRDGVVTAWCR